MGVLPVPARPAADPAVAADPAGARKYTPRAYIFGRIWKYLRGFRLSSAPQRDLAPREGAPILLSFCSFVEIL